MSLLETFNSDPGTSEIETKVDGIQADITTIDNKVDIITDEVTEVETHLHSYGKKFEVAAVANGEIHVADRIGDGSGSFQVDAGNDDWGAWVQLFGSSDTPAVAGKTFYDLHVIQVESTERAATYFIQIGFGATGAAALTANTYTDVIYTAQSNQIDSAPIAFQSKRQAAGTKAWARCKCPGQDTATINFYPGLHEYDE